MTLADVPPVAAWRHLAARTGFEVVFLRADGAAWRIEGRVTAVEDGQPWEVGYAIAVDERWVTRCARVRTRSALGVDEVEIVHDGHGAWRVGGAAAPQLDGILDVDLEASAMTNALPVRRMGLAVGAEQQAPAAYVRVADARVERLEQRYARVPDGRAGPCFDYAAPAFGFACRLAYDRGGLVLDYPGIAVRAA